MGNINEKVVFGLLVEGNSTLLQAGPQDRSMAVLNTVKGPCKHKLCSFMTLRYQLAVIVVYNKDSDESNRID